MSHDHGQHCHCRIEHRPEPLELHQHHIWPKAMGGPDTPDNLVWLCPTTHTNVHELLRLMLRIGRLTYAEVDSFYDQPVSRYAYNLAVRGHFLVTHRVVR